MTFKVNKMHKLQDQMESLAHDWVWEDISEYYEVEEIEHLNQEQVDEIYQYSESDECYEGMVGVTLRSMCEQWEDGQ